MFLKKMLCGHFCIFNEKENKISVNYVRTHIIKECSLLVNSLVLSNYIFFL